ncbi:MAG: DUF4926 domain-containing protein [Gammaproteobacteria bacterium]|nr:DUF4926 domain-containing protein [Gammaproteobacteria bacterium]
MIHELDLVALAENLPEYGLEAGDIGTVVLVHQAGKGFEVEFATLSGETLAVVTVADTAIRAIGKREIAHVREVA